MVASGTGTIFYDFVVIGGGSAGLTAAKFASRLGRKVAIIEADRLGGDCTWTGCVPSKALVRAARTAHAVREAREFGIEASEPSANFPAIMSRIGSVIEDIYLPETPEALKAEGIDTYLAQAEFLDPNTVIAGDAAIRFRKLLICTGARPSVPPIEGLAHTRFLTYESLWGLETLPNHLLVVGGGPIGCELAQAFRRLGCEVTLFEAAERLLGQDEPEASDLVVSTLSSEGVRLQLGKPISKVSGTGEQVRLVSEGSEWVGDQLLVATGRRPDTGSLKLENARVDCLAGGIKVDRFLQTSQGHIYAAGDCTGAPQFTHYAGWQGFMAARNALLPGRSRGTLASVPWTTFTDPEVAQAGLTELQAREQYGESVKTVLWPLEKTDRAVIDQWKRGFIKAVTLKNGRLLGASVVNPRAGEMIHEWALAIDHRLKLGDMANTLHVYPTYSMGTMQMAAENRVSRLLDGPGGKIIQALTRLGR